jgi:hypothetical protein
MQAYRILDIVGLENGGRISIWGKLEAALLVLYVSC